jgi:hypothetical protein
MNLNVMKHDTVLHFCEGWSRHRMHKDKMLSYRSLHAVPFVTFVAVFHTIENALTGPLCPYCHVAFTGPRARSSSSRLPLPSAAFAC